jgi:hypothetical protein
MSMTTGMSASTSWTASCPPAAAATRSAPRRAASLPAPRAPAPVLGRGPARPLQLIAVPGGIEDYFHEINTASTDAERHRIGERYGIRVVPG